jgi:hypothetical protein
MFGIGTALCLGLSVLAEERVGFWQRTGLGFLLCARGSTRAWTTCSEPAMDERNPEVDAWFDRYDNPQKDLVQAVREVVLGADDRVTETIKWQAPTFVYRGNIASFFPRSKKHVSLMFHQGALLPDPAGILRGDGGTSRSLKLTDAADLDTQASCDRRARRSLDRPQGRNVAQTE